MQWIAPSEKDSATSTLEKSLWDAADQFRANSGLKSQEYSAPVLGLIFLRFAELRFSAQHKKLEKASSSSRRGSRVDEPDAYHAEGILYLSPEARFDYLLGLPEAEDIGAKVNAAMRDIEKQNPQLAGVLPKTYNLFTSTLLKELLKKVSEIPASLDYDAFGRIYEYFLGEFAMSEGQGGGEFYTPSCIVRLLIGSHRALPRTHPRPRLRFGRHVRPIGALRGGAQEEPRCRTLHPRHREDRRNRSPLPDEPGRPRPRRRHPPRRQRQQLLRRPARRHRTFRLRPRQSAVQRQRRGQGTAEGLRRRRPPLPLRPAAHRQRQLSLDSALLLRAERQGPRRLRHGQLRLRRPLLRTGNPAETHRRTGPWM